jgi:hypothetical protein
VISPSRLQRSPKIIKFLRTLMGRMAKDLRKKARSKIPQTALVKIEEKRLRNRIKEIKVIQILLKREKMLVFKMETRI